MSIKESVGRNTLQPSLIDQLNRYNLHKPAVITSQQHRSNEETLVNRCLQVIVDNFEEIDITSKAAEAIPPHQIAIIANKLPETVSPLISAKRVHNEAYWKRLSLKKYGWSNCHLGDHGMRWKQLYFEKMVRDLLEECDGHDESIGHLRQVLITAKNYIFTISFQQLPSHIGIDELFALAPNLTRINLCYGVNKIDMQYDRVLFGMKLPDAISIEKLFKKCLNITTVILSRNIIDDDLLRLLFVGLERSTSVTHLDLSHNKITDFGVQLLSKMLVHDEAVLMTLNLSDNLIFREGGRHLSRALNRNRSLTRLDLRLNRLDDDGCEEIIRALLNNDALNDVNISSNRAGDKTAATLSTVLCNSVNNLQRLDASNNEFSWENMQCFLEALQKPKERRIVLEHLDLRNCPGYSAAYQTIEIIEELLQTGENPVSS